MGAGADRTVAVELLAKVSGYTLGMTDAASATNAAADSMTRAAAAQRKLEASQRSAVSATEKVAASQAAQAAQSRKQLQALTTVGKGFLTLGVVAGVGFGLAVKAALDFNAKMALVGTLAHASSVELSELSSAALGVGQRFGYTATQVADAEAELVKAGISVKNILGGALTGTLTLAAAGQINVADATEIAAAAMTQFALKGKDVPHIADLLAAGADKALGSVADLGLGLSQVGTTAHQFGFTLDDTVAVLAEFAQQGQIGQKAGTELNQALLQLAAPTQQAAGLMEKYGFTVYDAAGHFKSFASLADSMQTSFQGLTDAQRNQALAVIFGSRAIRAANILYQDGAATVLDWERKVNDAGFATQQATGKLDSLQGDLQKLKAAFQSGLIDTGDNSTTALRHLVQAITDVITWFDHLGPVAGTVVFDIAGVTTAAGLLGGAALIAVPKVVAFQEALAALRGTAVSTAEALAATAAAEDATGAAAAAGAGGGVAGRLLSGGSKVAAIAGPIGITAAVAGTIIQAADAQGQRNINDLAGRIVNDPKGQAAGLATAKKQLADYQTQLKQLGQNEAAAAKAHQLGASNAQGLARQYQTLKDKIDLYSAAIKIAAKSTATATTEAQKQEVAQGKASIALVLGGEDANATASAMILLGQGATGADDAVKALAKTIQTDMTNAAKAFEGDLDPIASFTGGNLTRQFSSSISQAKKFVADLNTVTARGLNPTTVAQLISEGPKQAGPVLQKLVGANGRALIKMTNQSQAALNRLEGQVVEDARLTAVAVNAQNDKIPQDLGVAMKIAAAKAKAGGTATAAGIAAALHIGLAKVYTIASEYGIGLEAGIGGGTRASETDIQKLQNRLATLNAIKANPSISLVGKQQVESDIQAIQAELARLTRLHVISIVANAKINLAITGKGNGAAVSDNPGYWGGTAGPAGISRYSMGGSVWGGPPGRDTVNARLNNGEEVTRTERANLWRPLLKAINNSPAFAGGGTFGRNSVMYQAPWTGTAGGGGHQTVFQVSVPKAQRNPYSFGEKVAIGAQRVLAVSTGSNTLPRW